MDRRDRLRAVWRLRWLVLGALVAGLGIAAAVTVLSPPRYAASVMFFVGASGHADGQGGGQGLTEAAPSGALSRLRMRSYVDLLGGERLASTVAAAGLDLTPAEISDRVSARAVPDTMLLEATVVDADPGRSERIAQALATAFPGLVETLETPPGGTSPAATVTVVAGPLLDPTPVFPPRPAPTLVLGGLLGLLLGVVGAVLRGVRDVTVRSPATLRSVSAAPVLAVVPYDRAARRSLRPPSGSASGAPRAEAYRHLRTNLSFVDVDRPAQVIVVTSALPGEGRSTTAVSLAIAFAELGRRVLLVDADLRRPRLANRLGLAGAAGLSDVLIGQVPVDQVVQVVQPWCVDGLAVLPGGAVPANPSELLGSGSMAALMERLRLRYDVVLFDTSPLLPVTDAAVVATHSDGAVLVAQSGRTPQPGVTAAVAGLRSVGVRVLGCVLTMQRVASDVCYDHHAYYRDTARARRVAGRSVSAGVKPLASRAAAPVGAAPSPGAVSAVLTPAVLTPTLVMSAVAHPTVSLPTVSPSMVSSATVVLPVVVPGTGRAGATDDSGPARSAR